MMPFWPDCKTLTDTLLITKEQKIPVLYQFWPKIINKAWLRFTWLYWVFWLSLVVFSVILYYLHLSCHLQYAAVRSCDRQIVINLIPAQAHQISCESDRRWHSYEIISIFKMADVSHVVFPVRLPLRDYSLTHSLTSGGPPTTCRWWCEFGHQILDWSDVWLRRYCNF